jgi:hypothetical protein
VSLAQRQGAIGLQVNLRVVASIQFMSPYVVNPCSQSIGQPAKLDGDLLLTGFFREGAERRGSPACWSVYSHSQEDLVEKTNNPITVTVFGNRQSENCWSSG